MPYTIHLRVERYDKELDLVITGTVSDFHQSITHLPSEYCEEDSGGLVEIQSITLHGKPWDGDLTDAELEQADDKLFDAYLKNNMFDDCDDVNQCSGKLDIS